MARFDVSHIDDAVLLFVDVVDSSSHSAFLGPVRWAEKLLRFQEIFDGLAQRCFSEPSLAKADWQRIIARGDEGTVFRIGPSDSVPNAVFRAVEFVIELKARLHMAFSSEEDPPARQLGVGAGIHVGPVACVTTLKGGRSVVDRIEGYSINYAKRVESCSREGQHTKVFLSAAAKKLMDGEPLVLEKMVLPMKGITDRAEVYEVRSGFFRGLPVETSGEDVEREIALAIQAVEQRDGLTEAWQRAHAVSVLDYCLRKHKGTEFEKRYADLLETLAWSNIAEEDPLLLMRRATDLGDKGRFTHQLQYLRDITGRWPDFVHARKAMIRACHEVACNDPERWERAYARDVAKEFLEHFPDLIDDDEREILGRIVENAEPT